MTLDGGKSECRYIPWHLKSRTCSASYICVCRRVGGPFFWLVSTERLRTLNMSTLPIHQDWSRFGHVEFQHFCCRHGEKGCFFNIQSCFVGKLDMLCFADFKAIWLVVTSNVWRNDPIWLVYSFQMGASTTTLASRHSTVLGGFNVMYVLRLCSRKWSNLTKTMLLLKRVEPTKESSWDHGCMDASNHQATPTYILET